MCITYMYLYAVRLMVKWLKYIANLLKNLCQALQDIPQQDHHKVCRELTRARWSHFYSLYDNQCEHPADIPTTGGAPVTTGDGTLVEGSSHWSNYSST